MEEWGLLPIQKDLITLVRDPVLRYYLFGGGMGGSKSYSIGLLAIQLADTYPNTRYGVFRKNLTTLKRTTYRSCLEAANDMNYKEDRDFTINRGDLIWTFPHPEGDSEIMFLDLDQSKDPDFNKLKSLNLTAAFIDEANEVREAAFDTLKGRVGRQNRNGEKAFILCTCNPDQNWVKSTWYIPWQQNRLKPPYAFLPSLPTDNPKLPAGYLDQLNDMPISFQKRYKEGDWDFIDDTDGLMSARVINKLVREIMAPEGIRCGAVDVAREGRDKVKMSLFQDGVLKEVYEPVITWEGADDEVALSDLVADKVIEFYTGRGVDGRHVMVDAVGNGGGVVDSCRAKGFFVQEFKGGAEPTSKKNDDGTHKYNNLRSQAYCEYADDADKGETWVEDTCQEITELKQEIMAHKVIRKPRHTIVEPKEKVKQRLGRSPDVADCVVMGYHMHKRLQFVGTYGNRHRDKERAKASSSRPKTAGLLGTKF